MSDNARWEYAMELSAPGAGLQQGEGVTQVEGHETINGKEYSRVVSTVKGIPGWPVSVTYRRHTKDAEYALDGDHLNDPAYERITLPLPPAVGKEWTNDTPDSHSIARIDAVETAELSDRKYANCLKIYYRETFKTGPEIVNGYEYLAPGIGDVKQFFARGDRKCTFSLEKYVP